MNDKLRKLYIDAPSWLSINVDDFIVAIGKTKSNSVYHIAEIKTKQSKRHPRLLRHYVKVFKSDLQTALKRDSGQRLISFNWYSRK